MIKGSQELAIFSFQSQFLRQINYILLKRFLWEYQSKRTTLVITSLVFSMCIKFHFVKICPIFVGSQLVVLQNFEKSFEDLYLYVRILLNFTCHIMKFHNCDCPYIDLNNHKNKRICCPFIPELIYPAVYRLAHTVSLSNVYKGSDFSEIN